MRVVLGGDGMLPEYFEALASRVRLEVPGYLGAILAVRWSIGGGVLHMDGGRTRDDGRMSRMDVLFSFFFHGSLSPPIYSTGNAILSI